MKFHWLLPLLLVFLCGCHASVTRPKGEPLVVSDFPVPPQQQARWDVVTNLISPEFASATRMLFDQSLADPRGCDYREIEIHVGEVRRGDGSIIKTHGWVLPGSSRSNRAFAVCWNGLVYPVVSVGAKANPQVDMESFINSTLTNSSRMRFDFYGRAFPEKESVAVNSLLPIKACLLSRLGQNDLAAKIWNACEISLQKQNFGQEQPNDPYLMLAGDWAWALFDRCICAHMRGDVPLALVSARELAEIQPKIEAEAAKRGLPHPFYSDTLKHDKERPYIYFLDQLPQLLVDLDRRAHEPKKKSVIEMGLTNFPNRSDRIAALIEDLDLVRARQFSQPGRVEPQEDPIVQALIKEDDSAVEPLLDCWQNDKRLTGSVGFGRDFFRDRYVIPVASAAKAAVQEILHAQFQNVMEARTYWRQNKGLKLEDRWYATLKDDHAGPDRWLEAAKNITQSANVIGVPGMGFYQTTPTPTPTPTNQPIRMRGESLRSKKHPSVSQLIAQRALESPSMETFPLPVKLNTGCEIGLCLASWDVQASDTTAKQLVDICRNAMATSRDQKQWIVERLGSFIGKLTMVRVRAGDTNALKDYAAWLKTMSPDRLETYLADSLEPVIKFPNEESIKAVTDELFNNPASPWSQLPWKEAGFFDPVESGLTKVPAFRKLLARELENQTAIGSMQWRMPNAVSYNLTNYISGSRAALSWPEGESTAGGAKVEIRQCDWIAWSLSNSKQIPFLNPFAPVKKRDEAIKSAETELLNSK